MNSSSAKIANGMITMPAASSHSQTSIQRLPQYLSFAHPKALWPCRALSILRLAGGRGGIEASLRCAYLPALPPFQSARHARPRTPETSSSRSRPQNTGSRPACAPMRSATFTAGWICSTACSTTSRRTMQGGAAAAHSSSSSWATSSIAGPDSAGVVERLLAFSKGPAPVRFLMGNHEEVFLRVLAGDVKAMRFFASHRRTRDDDELWLRRGGICLARFRER